MANHISIIGGGNMATSLIAGLIKSGHPAKKISVSDPTASKLKELKKKFKIHANTSNLKVAEEGDVLLFAVKPQQFKSVAEEVSKVVQEKKPLVISIAAGIRAASIQKWLAVKKNPIVRCMPNTPALIGQGITVLFANKATSLTQKKLAEKILKTVGQIEWAAQEKLMDVVTAVSGSGPAYFFWLMENIEKAAVELGMPVKMANRLVTYTALGAASLAIETQTDLALLREQVTSKGGTTEAALQVFEAGEAAKIVKKAIKAATKRSKELC